MQWKSKLPYQCTHSNFSLKRDKSNALIAEHDSLVLRNAFSANGNLIYTINLKKTPKYKRLELK